MASALQWALAMSAILLLSIASADVCADSCVASCGKKFTNDTVAFGSCQEGCKLRNAGKTPQDEADEFCSTLKLPSIDFDACEAAVDMLRECMEDPATMCLSICSDAC